MGERRAGLEVRFDERDLETETRSILQTPATKRAGQQVMIVPTSAAPDLDSTHVFFTKAGIVYFPRFETEPNLRMIDFIHPVVHVAGGEAWVGPTRGVDLTTRIRLTAVVVRGVAAMAGWKETSAAVFQGRQAGGCYRLASSSRTSAWHGRGEPSG